MFCAAILLAGCPDKPSDPKSDLVLAQEAKQNRDTGDAEMYFERYLRKNPKGGRRWEVWQELLTLALTIKQDKTTAREYLEIMLLEFEGDASKRREIQMRLADLCNETRAYVRAVGLWEALADDPGATDLDKAKVYRELSHAYLRRLEFTNATEALQRCLDLEVGGEVKADCLYDLAETQTLTDALEEAETSLRELMQIPQTSPERRVLAVFMLADVLEQQEKPDEALQLYESIRDTYPNSKVVEMRIAALKSPASSR